MAPKRRRKEVLVPGSLLPIPQPGKFHVRLAGLLIPQEELLRSSTCAIGLIGRRSLSICVYLLSGEPIVSRLPRRA